MQFIEKCLATKIAHFVLAGHYKSNLAAGISGNGDIGVLHYRIKLLTLCHHFLDEIQGEPYTFTYYASTSS